MFGWPKKTDFLNSRKAQNANTKNPIIPISPLKEHKKTRRWHGEDYISRRNKKPTNFNEIEGTEGTVQVGN